MLSLFPQLLFTSLCWVLEHYFNLVFVIPFVTACLLLYILHDHCALANNTTQYYTTHQPLCYWFMRFRFDALKYARSVERIETIIWLFKWEMKWKKMLRLYRSRYYVEWKITFINSSNSDAVVVVVAFIHWITCCAVFHIMLHVIQLIDSFGFIFRCNGMMVVVVGGSNFIFTVLWYHWTSSYERNC